MPATAHTTLRRLTLGAVLAGGIWLGLTALDGAAHADDTPAAVAESPGGVLGDVLDQTTGAVTDVVDQVLPKPEPTEEPAADPEPRSEPDEPAGPIETVLNTVEQVITPVAEPVVETATDIVETVTAPLPTPATPAPTPAPTSTPVATQPSTPASTTVDTTTDPAPATVPEPPAADEPAAEELPAGLPVPIGPIPGYDAPVADDGIHPAEPTTHTPGQCGDHEPAVDQVRTALRGLVAERQQRTPVRADQRGPARPCPEQPHGPVIQAGGPSAVALTGQDQHPHPAGDVIAGAPGGDPTSLRQLRARSAIPTGRGEHVEPRPA